MIEQVAISVLLLITAGYAVMLGWFALPLFRRKPLSRPGETFPFVSVIIAARNEEKNIRDCVNSILDQDYPADRFEILISDDHSEDRTSEEAEACRNINPAIHLTVLKAGDDAGTGKKNAIRRAVAVAAGEWILTTDADTRRGPGWLRAMTATALSENVKMTLGPVRMDGSSWFQRIQRLEFLGIMGLTAGSAARKMALMCNGANLMYKKAAFQETGGLTGNLKYASGDDQFLLADFRKRYGNAAAAFAFSREAIVSTEAQPTFRGFFSQRVRWVSKSPGYRDPQVIFTGALTFLSTMAILAALVAGFFVPGLLPVALGCLGIKMLVDLLPVIKMAVFFEATKDLWWYIPAQLFQLIYVPLVGLTGWLFPFQWKGRVIKA
ncbi:MAG TPA: glycosyltransferase [Bacteroidales bacterium]|nr:glycosyltransferase [Bacteroidales bacterium]